MEGSVKGSVTEGGGVVYVTHGYHPRRVGEAPRTCSVACRGGWMLPMEHHPWRVILPG